MLLAQGLGEYGALSGGLSGMANLIDAAEDTFGNLEPTTWVLIFIGVLVIWFVFFRTR